METNSKLLYCTPSLQLHPLLRSGAAVTQGGHVIMQGFNFRSKNTPRPPPASLIRFTARPCLQQQGRLLHVLSAASLT